jgi:hypothetical protein
MKHDLKIQHKWLIRILVGEKSFEVRLNDRDFQVGDTIKFLPLHNEKETVNAYDYQSPIPLYAITYVHSGLGMAEGYVVLGIKELTAQKEGENGIT